MTMNERGVMFDFPMNVERSDDRVGKTLEQAINTQKPNLYNSDHPDVFYP
jgi:hypothetical protein